MSKRGLFALDRRAFFAAATASLGALGVPGLGAAKTIRATAVEPDLADATANAPGYVDQPRRRSPSVAADEPLDLALRS